MNATTWLVIISSIASYVTASLVFYAYIRFRRSQQTKDRSEMRVQMDIIRASLEKELYSVNAKLELTEERWKDVNHLLLSPSHPEDDIKDDPFPIVYSHFLDRHGITEKDITIEDDLVFALTPFHSQHRPFYETITHVCKSEGLRCMRGDEEFIAGDIFQHVLRLLVKARLVVVNISGRNPNVFYELGIAHALDKHVILVASRADELPFDVRSKRVIIYRSHGDLSRKFSRVLREMKHTEKLKSDTAKLFEKGDRSDLSLTD